MKALLTLSKSDSLRGGMEVYADYLKMAFPDLEVIDFDSSKKEAFGAGFSPLKQPLVARAVAKHFVRKYAADDVEIIFTNGMFGWALEKEKFHAPLVNISHGCYAPFADSAMKRTNLDYYRIRFIYSFFEKASALNADVRVSNSAFTREMMKKYYSLDSMVICNAVDSALFRPIAREKARDLLGLPRDRKIAIFVGRPDYSKGFDVVRAVARQNPEILFMCILFPAVRVPERNILVGGALPHRELPKYYSAADACIFPSRYEGFGYVPIEALACNTPVVASKTGIMSEIELDGACVLDGFDAQRYSIALNELMDRRFRTRGFVEKNFPLSAFIKKYKKLERAIRF